MQGIFEATDGQTPLSPDECEGLIPGHIATRAQLNEWELENVSSGIQWAQNARLATEQLLTERYLRMLHRKMFGATWRWAGTFRRSDKNVGIDWQQVPIQLNQQLENYRYRLAQGGLDTDQIATEFHHRLVYVHPFPNGNGRWARVATDLLLQSMDALPFSWGRVQLVDITETRQHYVAALRAADRGDYQPLREFVRS